MPITNDELTALRDAQFTHTAEVLISATKYFSDSVVDPVTAALDASSTINFLAYDSDIAGFEAWLLDPDEGPTTFCDEGLCAALIALLPNEED